MKKKEKETAPEKTPDIQPEIRVNPWTVLLIILAAFTVRVLFLGRTEMWGDEINFANIIANPQYSIEQVFLNYWNYVVAMAQLPLSGVILNAYMHALSSLVTDIFHSSALLRLPGVVVASLGVPAVYLAARRFFTSGVAWTATAMALFFFYPVYYAREVYCYPYILCFAPWALYFYLCSLFGGAKLHLAALAAVSAGLVLSHFAGTMLLAAMGLVAAGWWLYALYISRDKEQGGRAFRTGAACSVAAAAVAPYWWRVLSQDTPHLGQACDVSVWTIANDVVSKMFLGDIAWVSIVAWLILFIGIAAFLRNRTKVSVTVALVLLVGGILLIGATKSSQYLSARYFSPLMPLLYLGFAQGIWTLAGWAGKLRSASAETTTRVVALTITVLITAVHIFIFLPDMYRLKEKGVPYASIAEWLNKNARPGTPYSFDCGGWDMRYVPGYHPTPQLTPCVWIAWNGPDFDPQKKSIQRQIMSRFPESVYIASPSALWPEAVKFYRSKYELRNEPLIHLRRRGIWVDVNTTNCAVEFRDIYYNTRSDALTEARDDGRPVFVDYDGFRAEQVGREVYAHITEQPRASIRLQNLKGQPVQVGMTLEGAVAGLPVIFDSTLKLDGTVVSEFAWTGGQFQKMDVPQFILPPGEHVLSWEARGQSRVPAKALCILNLTFR